MKNVKKKSDWIRVAAHLIRPINTARLRSFNVTARLFSSQPSSVWTASTYLHDMRNDTNCVKPQKVSLRRLICFQSAVVIVSRRNLERGRGGGDNSLFSCRHQSREFVESDRRDNIITRTCRDGDEENVRLNILRFRTAELKLRRTGGASVVTSLAVLPQQVLSYQLEVVIFFSRSVCTRAFFILALSSRMSHAESK